jgi:hypothetical protein
LFLVSAVGKITSPDDFHSFVRSIPWVSGFGSGALLYAVVIVELALVLLLVISRTSNFGGVAAFVVLFGFTVVLLYASQTGYEQPCGCFGGVMDGGSIGSSILRNSVLMLLSALLLQNHVAGSIFGNPKSKRNKECYEK